MTDNQTPEPVDDATEQASGGNREAAKYRRQLRGTEAARDALQATLQATRQTLLDKSLADYMTVEYIPTGGNIPHTPDGEPTPMSAKIRLKHASDFAQFTGHDIDALLADDGTFDGNKMQSALAELWQQRPELFDDATSGAVHTIGKDPGRNLDRGDDFTAAFGPKKK